MSEDFTINVENQLKLVASILSAKKPENEVMNNLKLFESLLNKDYAEFARNEETYKDDAGAYRVLQNVLAQLTEIASFPMLFTKNIVAVAGGFSSGKSQFLNTFFKNKDVQLSVGINPVTAIPTYIIADEKPCITAFTPDGRQGNIPADIFNKIDHNLIDSLHFNLKSIMPNVTVGTPFNDSVCNLKNLCFVDTPGYNPSGINTYEDEEVALETLNLASVILWAISIDSGAIHQTDINILNKILVSNENSKIFIICTKSDLRSPSQVQEVMQQITENLDDEGINIEGITAVTAKTGKLVETLFEENPISVFDFLQKQNEVKVNTILRCRKLSEQVDNIFDAYKQALESDIERIQFIKKRLIDKRIQYEKMKDNYEQQLNDAREIILSNGQMAKKGFRIEENDIDFDIDYSDFVEDRIPQDKKNLEMTVKLCKSMKNAIYKIFPEMRCPKCNEKVDPDSPFCTHCGNNLLAEKVCPKCGIADDGCSDFCSNCGQKLK